mmetsp:Transcript_58986/g.144672  ORF Transcript_58986/g.144672 Transcript_58986/m.144672 type:complete len:204 (-) Transcript_58986:1669-2280(-)
MGTRRCGTLRMWGIWISRTRRWPRLLRWLIFGQMRSWMGGSGRRGPLTASRRSSSGSCASNSRVTTACARSPTTAPTCTSTGPSQSTTAASTAPARSAAAPSSPQAITTCWSNSSRTAADLPSWSPTLGLIRGTMRFRCPACGTIRTRAARPRRPRPSATSLRGRWRTRGTARFGTGTRWGGCGCAPSPTSRGSSRRRLIRRR